MMAVAGRAGEEVATSGGHSSRPAVISSRSLPVVAAPRLTLSDARGRGVVTLLLLKVLVKGGGGGWILGFIGMSEYQILEEKVVYPPCICMYYIDCLHIANLYLVTQEFTEEILP